jgi:hypothetical protein
METKKKGIVISKQREKQIESMTNIHFNKGEVQNALFNHSVLCQTYFPYTDPGNKSIYEHRQGNASLAIQAMQALNPVSKQYEFVGIPWGAKARLLSFHINTKAIQQQSRIVSVEDSMSAFIQSMGLNRDGYTIASIKDQLMRLSNCIISLGYSEDAIHVKQVHFSIIKAFEFWGGLPSQQKALWNSTIELSEDYFNSLIGHSIPLDERALCALSNAPMALDIYAWLAQRLHRLNPEHPQFVAWQNIKDQFGRDYDRMDNFKMKYRRNLKLVKEQYPDAKIEEIPNKGFTLKHSLSPIKPKSIFMAGIKNA